MPGSPSADKNLAGIKGCTTCVRTSLNGNELTSAIFCAEFVVEPWHMKSVLKDFNQVGGSDALNYKFEVGIDGINYKFEVGVEAPHLKSVGNSPPTKLKSALMRSTTKL
jgi:hypothetical protein